MLMRGHVPDGMDRVLAQEVQRLQQVPLNINDQPPATIAGIRSELRRMSRMEKIAAIGLDYLQLVSGNGNNRNANRENEVSEISRTVKLMADELGVPFIVASQLNRGLEARPNKRPMLSDLCESGASEQDSALVIFPYRPSVYDPTAPASEAELIVAKNRNGACATAYVDWEGPQVRFRDSSRTGPINEAPAVNGHGANGSGHQGPSGGYGGVDPFGGF
jgi:replicative DNA helicase